MRASSPGVQGPSPPHAPQPIPRSSSATTLALGSAREAHTHSFTSLHLLTELLGREPGALSVPSALWWGSSVTHPCLSPTGASSIGCLLLFPLDLPAQLLWVTGHQPSSTSLVPLTECLPTASQAGQGPAWRKGKTCHGKKTNSWGQGPFQPAELGYATGALSWNVPRTLRTGITLILFQDGMRDLLATEENPCPFSLFIESINKF